MPYRENLYPIIEQQKHQIEEERRKSDQSAQRKAQRGNLKETLVYLAKQALNICLEGDASLQLKRRSNNYIDVLHEEALQENKKRDELTVKIALAGRTFGPEEIKKIFPNTSFDNFPTPTLTDIVPAKYADMVVAEMRENFRFYLEWPITLQELHDTIKRLGFTIEFKGTEKKFQKLTISKETQLMIFLRWKWVYL